MYPHNKIVLSAEQHKQISAFYQQGHGIANISRLVGLTRWTVGKSLAVSRTPLRYGFHGQQLLTAENFDAPNPSGICQCGCGKRTPLAKRTSRKKGWLKGYPTRFCPLHRDWSKPNRLKHGLSRTPEYTAFMDAKKRCTNPEHSSWHNYGGRGIEFRFVSLQDFVDEVGKRPSAKHSIERVDNNGHYEVGNLTWATKREQALNRRKPSQFTSSQSNAKTQLEAI